MPVYLKLHKLVKIAISKEEYERIKDDKGALVYALMFDSEREDPILDEDLIVDHWWGHS